MEKTNGLILILVAIVLICSLPSCSLDLDIPVPCLFCYDTTPIEQGLKTTVSGKAYDYVWEKPLSGIKVYLEHIEDVGYRKSTYVDSTLTDSNGNYSLSFITDGVAYAYFIVFRPTPLGHYETNSHQYEINNFGSSETFDFNAAKLNIAIVKLHVVDNPNPPMWVQTWHNSWRLEGVSYDSTIWLFVAPNRINSIFFSINNPDTVFRTNYKIDTVNLIGNYRDTVYKEFTVRPKEFKLRR